MYSRPLVRQYWGLPKNVYLVRTCKEPPWWGVQINPSGFQVVQVRHCSSLIFSGLVLTYTITQDCITLFRKQSDIVRRNSVFVDKIVNPAEKRSLTTKLNKWSYLAKDSLQSRQFIVASHSESFYRSTQHKQYEKKPAVPRNRNWPTVSASQLWMITQSCSVRFLGTPQLLLPTGRHGNFITSETLALREILKQHITYVIISLLED